MPPGIPFIVGNELAERFSFYGMRSILLVYMTTYLYQSDGTLDVFGNKEAEAWVHLFVGSAYLFPILGGIVADALWGKYKTILLLSLIYCLGHACLACMGWVGHTRVFLAFIPVAWIGHDPGHNKHWSAHSFCSGPC